MKDKDRRKSRSSSRSQSYNNEIPQSLSYDIIDLPNKQVSKPRLNYKGYQMAIVKTGLMLKQNKWKQKQLRLFELYCDGELHYYDEKELKGFYKITKNSKVSLIDKDKNNVHIQLKNIFKRNKLVDLENLFQIEATTLDQSNE